MEGASVPMMLASAVGAVGTLLLIANLLIGIANWRGRGPSPVGLVGPVLLLLAAGLAALAGQGFSAGLFLVLAVVDGVLGIGGQWWRDRPGHPLHRRGADDVSP